MIGLVIPDYSSSTFFKRLGDALVAAGKDAGYTMLLGELPGHTPGERAHEAIALAQEYARRKVAGVIINLSAGFSLGKHLIDSGAKRVGFLMPPHSASTNLQRMLGVAGAVILSGLSWSDKNILCVPAVDKSALKKALSGKHAPDALVCHNDTTAILMPRSVKVAGFDGLDIPQNMHMALTYLHIF